MHDKGLPIVFFDRAAEDIKTHKVTLDNFQGAYDATAHLIKNGFQRIAHVTHSAHLSLAKERLRGYKQALEDNNIVFNQSYVKVCRHGISIIAEIEEGIKELLKMKLKPDAVFAVSDRLTMGTLSALKKAGIKVPNDMGVVGFSNSDIIDLLQPSLTSIKQPAFEMGQIATELLIELIESKKPVTDFSNIILKAELLVRESSAKRNNI